MICRSRKLIFVHIPKCGGTSVEDCIWPPPLERTEAMLWGGLVNAYFNKYQTGGLQHLTAALIRREVGASLFSECFTFAVCRHPVDRIVSQFKYIRSRPDLREFIDLKDPYDFDQYLERISSRTHVQWMPQAAFVQDEDGNLLVDRVYKLEDLSSDVSPSASDLGMEITSLPRNNTTDDLETPTLSARQIGRIQEMYKHDLDSFQYERRSH